MEGVKEARVGDSAQEKTIDTAASFVELQFSLSRSANHIFDLLGLCNHQHQQDRSSPTET